MPWIPLIASTPSPAFAMAGERGLLEHGAGREYSLSTQARIPHSDGFTLLELLVALLVFAVLSVMTYGGLRNVLETERHGAVVSERLTELEMALLFIGRDLAQAVDRGVRDPLGTPRPAFAGGQAQRRLLELTCYQGGDGLLGRIEYMLDGDTLRRGRWLVLDAMPETEPQWSELLGGVAGIQLRFLDREWQQTWPAPGADAVLPRAVELTLRLREGTEFRRLFALPDTAMPDAPRPPGAGDSAGTPEATGTPDAADGADDSEASGTPDPPEVSDIPDTPDA